MMTATVQRDDRCEARVDELAHLGAIAGELNQRNHGEWQLKTQHHLTEDEQRSDFGFAGDADDQNRRNDRDRASDQAAHPGLEANVQKAFHDDLPGERAGERGVLSGSQERAGKERAGEAGAQNGTEKFVGVGNFGDVVEAVRVKRRRAEDQEWRR